MTLSIIQSSVIYDPTVSHSGFTSHFHNGWIASTNTPVVIKKIVSQSDLCFVKEKTALEKLNALYPNGPFVKLYGCPEPHTLVLEKLEDTIAKRNPKDGFSGTDTINITKQIVQAVLLLHDVLIVHRDLHTRNILFTANNKIKLIDFGSSIVFSSDEKTFYTQAADDLRMVAMIALTILNGSSMNITTYFGQKALIDLTKKKFGSKGHFFIDFFFVAFECTNIHKTYPTITSLLQRYD